MQPSVYGEEYLHGIAGVRRRSLHIPAALHRKLSILGESRETERLLWRGSSTTLFRGIWKNTGKQRTWFAWAFTAAVYFFDFWALVNLEKSYRNELVTIYRNACCQCEAFVCQPFSDAAKIEYYFLFSKHLIIKSLKKDSRCKGQTSLYIGSPLAPGGCCISPTALPSASILPFMWGSSPSFSLNRKNMV